MTNATKPKRKVSAESRRQAAVADNGADGCNAITFQPLHDLYKHDSTLSLSTVLVLLQVAKHYGEGLATTQAIADGLKHAQVNMSPQVVGRALKRLAEGGARPEISDGLGFVELGQGMLHERRGRPTTTAMKVWHD